MAVPVTQLLYYSNGVSANLYPSITTKSTTSFGSDSVGFCCKSKRIRRRIGIGVGVGSSRGSSGAKNRCSVKSVLSLEGKSNNKKSDCKVANLEDILSERGACGVGFIANLDNKGSHQIVKDALTALGCMEHRGGCGADNDSGDGSGVMTLIPWELFDNWANRQGLPSLDKAHTGVGMVFLPKDDGAMREAKKRSQSGRNPASICRC
ncbi:glutamate synthase (ferredoxin) [Ranunculus cassubicifolius]